MSDVPQDLLRELAPRVLGAVVRRYGNFALAEDAVQEALIAAASRWPGEGVPEKPLGWLVTVAARRYADLVRAERARRRREETVAAWTPPPPGPAGDDSLVLLFMCCHPALSPASRIALTLRAVGGLTTGEIARAFLVSEATMTRRVTRAKQTVKDSGIPFALPTGAERGERLTEVLRVLYLIFNEGYVGTGGRSLQRADLADEAIRLARLLHRLLPADGEVAGLLALMLLTDARRAARTGPDGLPVPMAEQDRRRWDTARIAEGASLLTAALSRDGLGPYRLQAAIAAVHDEAPGPEDTDWPRIVTLYEVLMRVDGNPVVRMNHAVAVAMASGPGAGLALLDRLGGLDGDHRYQAARAHLLEKTGEFAAAHEAYLRAADLTRNMAQRRFLLARAARPAG
ncbi:RNA polymerase sigma24 factor [Actinorhabdospora filicis]|uniref:RNA polymerase sigma24 factor n=1 Tax=Actinorhabdospora filicis TaxID=1785913 RepID=A0A9W6WCZ1_9ACTN|nr:DUF6596 domain-containing protein [Actinorhabdospora filicis]GLZ81578.1 RNA polymerase sigma24 factor [Actinorhabdospora filicis]